MPDQSGKLKAGDQVEWNTSQGKTHGVVARKVTDAAEAGGHTAHATPSAPEYEVKSDKSGKTAIHRPDALKKRQKGS
jgi:plastocyanin